MCASDVSLFYIEKYSEGALQSLRKSALHVFYCFMCMFSRFSFSMSFQTIHYESIMRFYYEIKIQEPNWPEARYYRVVRDKFKAWWDAKQQPYPKDPSDKVIKGVIDRHEAGKEVTPERPGGSKTVLTEDKKEEILMAHSAAGFPGLPQREMAAKVQVSVTTITRAYKELGIHSYSYLLRHQIPNAFSKDKRRLCAQTFLAVFAEFPTLLEWIIFSDESHFELVPHHNSTKMVIRSIGKPELEARILQRKSHPEYLTVWMGVSMRYGLIGPFLFRHPETGVRQTVNQKTYQDMIWTSLFDWLIVNVPEQDHNKLWFQQDGAVCYP